MLAQFQYDWLINDGYRALDQLRLSSIRPLVVDWSGTRFESWQQALLVEQLGFRQRAKDRFPNPNQWLWTDRSLQQASDWKSALFKASLFPKASRVIDACCGAGADLVALAREHDVVGIDRDPHMLQLARFHLHTHQLRGGLMRAELPQALGPLDDVCVHMDPDRRMGAERDTRTTKGDAFSPTLDDAIKIGERARSCVIKLAPATQVEAMPSGWRRCWLGSHRECPQQLLMRGALTMDIPADRHACVLVTREEPDRIFIGQPDYRCDFADEPEEYLFEPHPAMYAAGLAGAWAAVNGLRALPHARSYFTGASTACAPSSSDHAWAQTFRVLASMSWDDRRARKWLRAHGAGPVEIKTRQVPLDANDLQRRLSQSVGCPITCLLYPVGKSIRAVMAERISAPTQMVDRPT